MTDVLLDGRVYDGPLSLDRGLHFGDGVFESMAWIGDRVRFLDRHLRRLRRGCEALGIATPDEDAVRSDIATLEPGADRWVLKLIVTRGRGGFGYRGDPAMEPTRILLRRPWPALRSDDYRSGIVCDWLDFRLARQPALAGIKHLNRLEQVQAARELATGDADEGLLCDTTGAVIEAVSGNVMLAANGSLRTPRLQHCGVAGVMREVLFDKASADGIPCEESVLWRSDFAYADEVFICNSIRGIVPLRRLGRIRFGRFEMAARLAAALEEDGLEPCGT